MNIGVFAAFVSPIATPQLLADFGRRCEDAGLDSLWMGEHVVLFDRMEFPYPGSKDGRVPVPEGGGILDMVATFGFLAAATKRMRLGSGICLVPQRNPVYTAKEFATLDWLSGGRIGFGVGVGWCKEEAIACGYGWENRGRRCDEFLELIRTLWTEPVATYHGEYASVTQCRMDPKPIQKPHIPIIVGGHSAAAMRRAARFGAGWYGFGLDADATRTALKHLDAALADSGRKRGARFEIIVTPPYEITPDMAAAYKEMGVDRLVVQLGRQRLPDIEARLKTIEGLVGAATRGPH
ncbi:MAG TPA: TIGR03619 family F420-dependent LLM class oxidoreductase [Rhizomicrobium sp.]